MLLKRTVRRYVIDCGLAVMEVEVKVEIKSS